MNDRQDTSIDPSALCVPCGLCCTGAIFDRTPVTDEEVSKVDPERLVRAEGDKGHAFTQPCPHHQADNSCAIYTSRFKACKDFSCALLDRYKRGDIALEDALATSQQAIEKLRQPDGSLLHRTQRKARLLALENWEAITDPAERRTAAIEHLKLLTTDRLIGQNFLSAVESTAE